MRRARLLDAAALVFAALAIALMFPAVVTGRGFLWGDFVSWYFPAHDYAAERWRAGAFPLWNPYSDGGMPFAGEADHASFYPPSLLLHQLASSRAGLFYGLELFTLAHVWLAIAATWALLRSMGCGRAGALLAGLSYGLGSLFVARGAQVSLVCAQAWAPLVLMATRQATLGRSPLRNAARAGLCLGLLTLAGSPATLAVTVVGLAIVLGAEVLADRERRGAALRAVCVLAGVSILGLAIGAVQLLPIVEFLRQSERGAYTFADLAEFTVSPASLILLLVPKFYGWLIYEQPAYWGPSNFVELSGYVGLLPLALAPLALTRERRRAWPWLGLAGLGLLLALGPHGGLQRMFYELVPVIGELRTPARYLQLWALGVAVLAGLGLDRALADDGARRFRPALVRSLVATAAFAAVLAVLWPSLRTLLDEWKQPFFDTAMAMSLRSCAWTLLALALLVRAPRWRGCVPVVLLALTSDLLVQGQRVGVLGEPAAMRALWERSGPVDAALSADPSVFRVRDHYRGHADLMLARLQTDSGPGRHVLRYQRFQDAILSLHSRLLDLFGIRYVLQVQNAAVAGLGPSLVAPEAVWLRGGQTRRLVVDPPTRVHGLALVSSTNSMDRSPGEVVATLVLAGADGERRSVPIRLGRETGDFVADLGGGEPLEVAHYVHVSDAGSRLRRHYLARVAVAPLDLVRIEMTHVGGLSEWVLKELYLEADDRGAGGFTEVAAEPRTETIRHVLFRNEAAFPRAFVAPAYRHVDGLDAALDAVSAEAFDPRAEVVIERERSIAPEPPVAAFGPRAARVESYAPEQVVVSALVPDAGAWLVLGDVDFPGWSAEVDGRPAPIARADALLRAVWLSGGHHRVVFRYAPRSVAVGGWLTLAGVLLSGLALLASRRGGDSADTIA